MQRELKYYSSCRTLFGQVAVRFFVRFAVGSQIYPKHAHRTSTRIRSNFRGTMIKTQANMRIQRKHPAVVGSVSLNNSTLGVGVFNDIQVEIWQVVVHQLQYHGFSHMVHVVHASFDPSHGHIIHHGMQNFRSPYCMCVAPHSAVLCGTMHTTW